LAARDYSAVTSARRLSGLNGRAVTVARISRCAVPGLPQMTVTALDDERPVIVLEQQLVRLSLPRGHVRHCAPPLAGSARTI